MPTIPLGVTIGRNVARRRARRGWTQAALAARVRLHRVSLAQIERGTSRPSLQTLERLARALGVKPGRLLDE
jgi:transcriptional regulator with XRE-family HTH domain